MECMSLLGFGACATDAGFREKLPFAATDIIRDAIPALLRRRTSQATQMAFSAAVTACLQAGLAPSLLPSIFASVAGEIQTTDLLCRELVKPEGVVSPNAFHNSVQNTAPGYWSIAQQCRQPASALAAGHDTFAMALLEAWCQLACHGGELLLVCYDERWPDYLAPGEGQPAFACALVLAAGAVEDGLAHIGKPGLGSAIFDAEWEILAARMPILAAIPLLALASNRIERGVIALSSGSPAWQAEVTFPD